MAAVKPIRHAPERALITEELFEAQLERLRRECRDPVAGVFGPGSMMWEVNKYPLSAMQGSGRALLLQIAHPWVTNAIDEHSKTRDDPVGRGERTFTHVGRMVFGSLDQAIDSAHIVYRLHSEIRGKLLAGSKATPAGNDYAANEIAASVWVHATLWDTAARMYEMFVRPLTAEEKERYYQETRRFAWMFGIPDDVLPKDWNAFQAYCEDMYNGPELQVNKNTMELAGFLFKPKQKYLRTGMKWITMVSAVTMPPKLRDAFGLRDDAKTRRRVKAGVALFKAYNRVAPGRIVYNPTFIEAEERIAGKPTDWLTRRLNKLAFRKEELVGLNG